MNSMLEDLPKHKRIRHLLKEKLDSGEFKSHDRFYSESVLQSMFDASIPTIRMALKDLMVEGLIYREHGKGTFVAPRSSKDKILIVGRFSSDSMESDFGLQELLRSFLGNPIEDRHSFSPVTIDSLRFSEIVLDLQFHYPDVKAILFFRDYELLLANRELLDAADLPYMFYGSDTAKDRLKGVHTYFYKEESIIRTGIEYLIQEYGENMAFVHTTRELPVMSRRRELYGKIMKEMGLSPNYLVFENHQSSAHEHNHREMSQLISSTGRAYRSLFCIDDWIALYCQGAIQNIGLSMPGHIALLGINDYSFCRLVYPSLSSIKIPVYQDGLNCLDQLLDRIAGKKTKSISYSNAVLVSRMSS